MDGQEDGLEINPFLYDKLCISSPWEKEEIQELVWRQVEHHLGENYIFSFSLFLPSLSSFLFFNRWVLVCCPGWPYTLAMGWFPPTSASWAAETTGAHDHAWLRITFLFHNTHTKMPMWITELKINIKCLRWICSYIWRRGN
jgi:hypothetical protein